MADVEKEVVEETTTETKPDAEESHESLETLYGEEEDAPEAAAEQQEALGEEEPEAEVVATGAEKPDAGESDDLTDEQVAALPPDSKGKHKAMMAERGKRKAADALVATRDQEITELAGQVKQLMGMLQNPAQAKAVTETGAKTDEEAKTFWEDPEGFITRSLEGVTGTVGQLSEAQQSLRYNMSETSAKSRHEDYGNNLAVLVAALKSHPNREEAKAYKDQLFASADPAESAYQAGKQLSQRAAIAEAGGFDAYVAKLADEKVAALQEGAAETEADEVVAGANVLPKSMAARRGVGAGGKHPGPDYSTDVSLEDLYDNG